MHYKGGSASLHQPAFLHPFCCFIFASFFCSILLPFGGPNWCQKDVQMEPFCVSFFDFLPTVHFCNFATHVLWQLRLCVSSKMLFFLRFFHYFHLHAFCCFFLFGHLLPPQFASILGPRSGPNRAPNWCKKKTQIWLVFGSHFGSILGSFWVHFGSQNRTRNCVEFTSTFMPLSGALLGLRGVHFGSPRSPLWALWSPHWPP